MSIPCEKQDTDTLTWTDDAITAGYRVFQRKKGHRYSVDDVATAYIAAKEAKEWELSNLFDGGSKHELQFACDIGTGLGSVLLMLAWTFQGAFFCGIEAQEESFELLEKNITRNDLLQRVHMVHGDLRDNKSQEDVLAFVSKQASNRSIEKVEKVEKGLNPPKFQLVTGTPPYFPEGTAMAAKDKQRSYARIEYRGGVEAYTAAAHALLEDQGLFFLCTASFYGERVRKSILDTDFHLYLKVDVYPRAGKGALFTIWGFQKCVHKNAAQKPYREETLVIRNEEGKITEEAHQMRLFFGMTSGREKEV